MKRTLAVTLALAVLLAGLAPAAAAAPGDAPNVQSDDDPCEGDRGPGDDVGPPGFLADLTPDFLADLLGSLPVPAFVKSAFGAC